MVKTSPSNARDMGPIPDQVTKIPHASWPKNQNSVVTNSIKTFKMLYITKKIKGKKQLNKKEVMVIIANTV